MGAFPKRRIIVVDDDLATRRLIQKQLELAGYVSPVRRTSRANPLESTHADSDHQR